MKEAQFQHELAEALRRVGCWMMKWPDQPVSAMRQGGDGKLRFALPKPCDLVGCLPPEGRLLAIEAKLARAPRFQIDARLCRQLETLRALQALGAVAAVALNFRFVRRRPPRRVNRAFLFTGLAGEAWQEGRSFVVPCASASRLETRPPAAPPRSTELKRIPGGWELPEWPMILEETPWRRGGGRKSGGKRCPPERVDG